MRNVSDYWIVIQKVQRGELFSKSLQERVAKTKTGEWDSKFPRDIVVTKPGW